MTGNDTSLKKVVHCRTIGHKEKFTNVVLLHYFCSVVGLLSRFTNSILFLHRGSQPQVRGPVPVQRSFGAGSQWDKMYFSFTSFKNNPFTFSVAILWVNSEVPKVDCAPPRGGGVPLQRGTAGMNE